MGNNCCCKKKHSYHFHVTEVVEDKIKDVFGFNFGGHHDLKHMVEDAVATGKITEKHAKELVCGLRLLHHVLKKYPGNPIFQQIWPALEDFKHAVKKEFCCPCDNGEK